jgi:hypothetical protein
VQPHPDIVVFELLADNESLHEFLDLYALFDLRMILDAINCFAPPGIFPASLNDSGRIIHTKAQFRPFDLCFEASPPFLDNQGRLNHSDVHFEESYYFHQTADIHVHNFVVREFLPKLRVLGPIHRDIRHQLSPVASFSPQLLGFSTVAPALDIGHSFGLGGPRHHA